MELNSLIELMEDVRPGTFTRFNYETKCPVKAEFKKQGIEIIKLVSTTARFKINYGNIKAVKEREAEKTFSNKTSNYKAVVKNSIYYNTNTEKYYLNVYPIKNSHSKISYFIKSSKGWKTIKKEDVEKYVISSYFNKSQTSMFRINVENVYSVKGRWA